MAGAVRGRSRQDLQAGEAAPQRIIAGVLQRPFGRIDDAGAVAGARAAGLPVPVRRRQAQTAGRKARDGVGRLRAPDARADAASWAASRPLSGARKQALWSRAA